MATVSDSVRRARPLLGTFVEITVEAARRREIDAAIDAAFEAVARAHELMSFHEPESDIGRLNREAGQRPVAVDAWTFEVLEAAVEMHRRSNGRFDVTVAPDLQALGLLPSVEGNFPAARGLASTGAIELLPNRTVRFRSAGVMVDLGGIAKGFAVDRAIEAMRGFDVSGGLVNAGGDLRAFGKGARTVDVRDPRNPHRSICRIEIEEKALASTARRFDLIDGTTSGTSAVIDPSTGNPAAGIDGATVRAGSCMIADALTKVAMISGTGIEALLQHYDASALLVAGDGDIQVSPNWNGAVHLAA